MNRIYSILNTFQVKNPSSLLIDLLVYTLKLFFRPCIILSLLLRYTFIKFFQFEKYFMNFEKKIAV